MHAKENVCRIAFLLNFLVGRCINRTAESKEVLNFLKYMLYIS